MKKVRPEGDVTRTVPRDEAVLSCPYLQTNVRWPSPVDQRLNELVGRLNAAGTDCTRSQLLAALVSTAPKGTADLQQLLGEYTMKTAGGVVLQTQGPIRISTRRPGRRPRY